MTISSFDSIFGHEETIKRLKLMVDKDRVPQSLLFAGSDGIGKGLVAQALAQLVIGTNNTNHSDIRHYLPEGKSGMHSIDSLREFNEAVYMAPFEAKKKVFIIHSADRMLGTSANALLKTFEEPALDSVIILLSSSPDEIWQTVLSRCQKIRFQPLTKELVVDYLVRTKDVPVDKAELIAVRSYGSIGRALNLLDVRREAIRKSLLDSLSSGTLTHYPHILTLKKEIYKAINDAVTEEAETLRDKRLAEFTDKPSAIQKNVIEQEVEGFATLRRTVEGHEVFDILLSWFRDLHLLRVKGDESLLANPDYRSELQKGIQDSNIPSLESLQKHISEVKTLLRRSSGLEFCLENLFLRLS